MPFLITDSDVPLLADTLPALKITEFCGTPTRGPVYAYWRGYVHKGGLHFSVCVFDEVPPPTARIGLAITADDCAARYFFVSMAAQGPLEAGVYARGASGPDVLVQPVALPGLRRFGGADEQGGYWGAEGVLPAALWAAHFGSVPVAGRVLPGNVFLYDTAQAAYGAAFAAPPGAGIPTAEGFSPFVVVPY